MGLSFWCFFGSVGVIAMVAAKHMPIHVFAAVVLSGWFVGNLSEYVGSASSGCWTFPHNPHYPPLYLVMGCWPLEILAQFSISAFLAGESLVDQDWLQSPARPSQSAAQGSNTGPSDAQSD
jgi:hypothetical protein